MPTSTSSASSACRKCRSISTRPPTRRGADVGTSKAKTAKAYIDATTDRPTANGSEDEALRARAQEVLVDAGLSPESFDLLGDEGGESE